MNTATKILLGALATSLLTWANHAATAEKCIGEVEERTRAVLDANGGSDLKLSFVNGSGHWTRHPTITGGEGMAEADRAKLLAALGGVAGLGSVNWTGGAAAAAPAAASEAKVAECQTNVDELLKGKTISFRDGSAYVDPSNGKLLDEMSATLKPCTGTVVEVSGHTSSTGSAALNDSLSQTRADNVRTELVKRGLAEAQVTAKGYGSSKPVDAANTKSDVNRRIEFNVASASAASTTTPAATPEAAAAQ